MPALAEENDILGRAVGEPLWKSRYNLEALKKEESRGLYRWSSLYQQNPVPGEGGFFKRAWFHVVNDPPEIVFAVRYWDLALSEKSTADFTVGLKMGLGVDGHYYILDIVRRRVDFGELVEFIAEIIFQDGHAVSQGIESVFIQTRVVEDLNADHRLHGS